MSNKYLSLTVTLSALCLLAIQLLIAAQGFYFLGDTNNYVEHALQGNPLVTFLWHHPIWPPLTAMVWNVLFRTQGVVLGLKLYLFLTTATTWFIVYKIGKLLEFPKTIQIIFPAIALFAGTHHVIWQSALSEPLLICLWWLSVYFLLLFYQSQKLWWLLLATISLATLPLIRYLGITLTVSAWIIIFFTSLRRKNLTELTLIVQSVILSLVPISYYLLRNKIQQGQFVPSMDVVGVASTLVDTAVIGGANVFKQIGWGLLITFGVGWLIPWNKKFSWPFWIIFFSSIIYTFVLTLTMNHYEVYAYLPARYAGVIFPNLLFITLFFGSWSRRYFNWVKYETTQQVVLVLVSGIFINLCILRWNYHIQEQIYSYNNLPEVAYSGDLVTDCPMQVVIHPYSRNWIVHSFSWLCNSNVVNVDSGSMVIKENEIVASPYNIPLSGKRENIFYAKKEFFVYKSTANQTINLLSVAAQRDYLE